MHSPRLVCQTRGGNRQHAGADRERGRDINPASKAMRDATAVLPGQAAPAGNAFVHVLQEAGNTLRAIERDKQAQEPSSMAVLATALIGFVMLAGLALRPLPAMPLAEEPAPLSAAAPAEHGYAAAPGEARHSCRPLSPCPTARTWPS